MSEEKQNAGLPVRPSVTPEGAQGHSLYSYAVKLGGAFHVVKDSEVDDMFELIRFITKMSRAQAERILHEGEAIRVPERFTVTAMRKQRAEFMPGAVVGYVGDRRVM